MALCCEFAHLVYEGESDLYHQRLVLGWIDQAGQLVVHSEWWTRLNVELVEAGTLG